MRVREINANEIFLHGRTELVPTHNNSNRTMNNAVLSAPILEIFHGASESPRPTYLIFRDCARILIFKKPDIVLNNPLYFSNTIYRIPMMDSDMNFSHLFAHLYVKTL